MSRADMYRFASQHFSAAAQWGNNITDVILASGNSTVSTHKLITASGHYEPIIIDFATRDGRKRLAEIQQAIASGDTTNLMELVFLPLYGREHGNGMAIPGHGHFHGAVGLYDVGRNDNGFLSKQFAPENLMGATGFLPAEHINGCIRPPDLIPAGDAPGKNIPNLLRCQAPDRVFRMNNGGYTVNGKKAFEFLKRLDTPALLPYTLPDIRCSR